MRHPGQLSSKGAARRRRSFRLAWGALWLLVAAGLAACDDDGTGDDAPASGGSSASGGSNASGGRAGDASGGTTSGGAPPSAGASGLPSSGASAGGVAATGGAAASPGATGGSAAAANAGSSGQAGAVAEGGATDGGASGAGAGGAGGPGGEGGAGGGCTGTAAPCLLACTNPTPTGSSASCQNGSWSCSQGVVASSCPGVCGGIPGPGEVCEDRQWVCRPEQKPGFFASCSSTACYSCRAFSAPVEVEGCRCTCTTVPGGDRVLCVRT